MAHKGAAADPSGPIAQKISADDHTEVDELGYDPASSPVLCASFACLARYYVDSLSDWTALTPALMAIGPQLSFPRAELFRPRKTIFSISASA